MVSLLLSMTAKVTLGESPLPRSRPSQSVCYPDREWFGPSGARSHVSDAAGSEAHCRATASQGDRQQHMRPASPLWPSALRLLPPLVIGKTSRYLYPVVGPCFSGNSVTTGKRKDKIHLTSGVRLSLKENHSNQ